MCLNLRRCQTRAINIRRFNIQMLTCMSGCVFRLSMDTTLCDSHTDNLYTNLSRDRSTVTPGPLHVGAHVIRPLDQIQLQMYSLRRGGRKRWGRRGPCACYYWSRGWAKWTRYGCMSYGTRGAEAWVWRSDDCLWHWSGAKSRRGACCKCYWFKNVHCYTSQ